MKIKNPFHPGEVFIQEEADEREMALLNGRMYEDVIMPPAHKFISQQFFLVMSAFSNGEISATVLYGNPGFTSPDESGKHLFISLTALKNADQDPVIGQLKIGDAVGTLAIELSSRRRLRINGHLIEKTAERLMIEVDESYGNCPMYIQKRQVEISTTDSSAEPGLITGSLLSSDAVEIINNSDTFFVGSMNPGGDADISHRGGNPGFVRFLSGDTLQIPDYKGNSLFNTFGNMHVYPKTTLVFWDFQKYRLLHLWGTSEVLINADDPENLTGGTKRFWQFKIERFTIQTNAIPFGLKLLEMSPFNPKA
jgi:hypothetical protein